MDELSPPSALPEYAASLRATRSVARADSRSGRRFVADGWPLVVILGLQAGLSLTLVWADTAFQDEATYLWAGHLEIAHWLHGSAIPAFPAYLSGAPVLYPPVGALADSLGGLAAARILSLLFMLGATALLWGSTRRLLGRRAAFFAAVLFVVLAPTLHLGTFATYDAMSLFLLALATWFVVRAGDSQAATRWLVGAGVVLAVANAVAYASAAFDVVVILLALLIPMRQLGVKTAVSRSLTVLIVGGVLITAGLLIGGSEYTHGVDVTTLQRVPGTATALDVLGDAWTWTGAVLVAGACGVLISWFRHEGGTQTCQLAVVTAAALIGPLLQARLHTAASLDKHVGAGAWFATIAAGYAVDKVIGAAPSGNGRVVTSAACVVALALPIALGVSQARGFATSWPESSDLVAVLRPLITRTTGPVLVEDPTVAEYYLQAESQWKRWSSTRNIVLPSGLSSGGPSQAAGVVGSGNAGTYAAKITSGYFDLVALNFTDTTWLDRQIKADLSKSGRYRLIRVVPYGPIPGTNVIGTYLIWQKDVTA